MINRTRFCLSIIFNSALFHAPFFFFSSHFTQKFLIIDIASMQLSSSIFPLISLQDFLEDLWERIQVLSSSGWKVESGNISSLCLFYYFEPFTLAINVNLYYLDTMGNKLFSIFSDTNLFSMASLCHLSSLE